ncbi:hypothetical protein GCM10007916_17080 [Psychromonas marina]|uniref:Uncharacterized protein n=1 Tax=Psychromonas marina TaxID=88364 RepID=A0ABQ6DZP7_9GAMM|nr:hypothetical protein [Psychromonas marina]GLS90641.1 hypothetical protein GCM10007916_17080 [Psychromonas marina]
MSNGDQLPLSSASQLLASLTLDSSCKFIALKINREGLNTALHAIYIETQTQPFDLPFVALVTVAEWDGKCAREEFFIEAESATLLMQKLQRFDEINRFAFMQLPHTATIDLMAMQPQALCCLLLPELGLFNKNASDEELRTLKNNAITLLNRLASTE